MKSKEIFVLAVKLVGFAMLVVAFLRVPEAIGRIVDDSFPWIQRRNEMVRTFDLKSFVSALFLVAWPTALSLWMLNGAPLVARIAFPRSPESEDD